MSDLRKIIHVDMDCFYAAIEIRDNPNLKKKPVAVGGVGGRGVLTTCNYEARKYGCHSAMPVFKALKACPNLVVLPVRHDLYKEESKKIRSIFYEFTNTVETVSLDEAYLDVSNLKSQSGSIAWEIRERIYNKTKLTASAGISYNKFLSKLASDYNKPNDQYEISESDAIKFLDELSVEKIHGVGKQTASLLKKAGIETCFQIRNKTQIELFKIVGSFATSLYRLSRGIDDSIVESNRERKSISVEKTFYKNLLSDKDIASNIFPIIKELKEDIFNYCKNRIIKECFVKIKFEDFKTRTIQEISREIDSNRIIYLLTKLWKKGKCKSIRLIGVGVRFFPNSKQDANQLELF